MQTPRRQSRRLRENNELEEVMLTTIGVLPMTQNQCQHLQRLNREGDANIEERLLTPKRQRLNQRDNVDNEKVSLTPRRKYATQRGDKADTKEAMMTPR